MQCKQLTGTHRLLPHGEDRALDDQPVVVSAARTGALAQALILLVGDDLEVRLVDAPLALACAQAGEVITVDQLAVKRVVEELANGLLGVGAFRKGLVATTTTNQNGGWSYKTNRGPSRIFRVGYRSGAFETSADLALHIRSRSTLHLSTHRTPIHKKVYFSGELPGPSCAGRTVFVSGTVPGARRRFIVRQATADALCHFRTHYAFSPILHASRFVFWVNVPNQEKGGYPYRPGRSVNRYIRVSPHPPKQAKNSR
jgi:hypothetical protein